jgi:hypothetical protein
MRLRQPVSAMIFTIAELGYRSGETTFGFVDAVRQAA